jgi:ABC-type polysaccharide/polyol phosphate export permease
MRQLHRWISILFVVIVAGIFIALGIGQKPANWIYFLPLFPLALLARTGLYLFVLPYTAKRRNRAR